MTQGPGAEWERRKRQLQLIFLCCPVRVPAPPDRRRDSAPPASSRLEDARGSAARAPTTAQAGDSPFEPFSPNWRPPAPKPPSPAGRTPAAGSQASHLRHACGRETLSPEALRVQPSDSESPRSRKRQQEHLLGSAPCTAFPEHVAPGGRARAWWPRFRGQRARALGRGFWG